jgi:sugar phosphate isomerase/epimerase
MRLGFHTLHASPMFGGRGDVDDVLAAACAAGFDTVGVDLTTVAGRSLARVRSAFDAAGLGCTDVVPLAIDRDLDVVAAAGELAALARALGAEWCVSSVLADLASDRLAGVLGEAADVLADAGTRLALEFMAHSHLRDLDAARRMRDRVGPERCAVVLDSFHCAQADTPLTEIAALDAAEIALVQYSDGPELHPDNLSDHSRNRRCLPGRGVFALHAWVDAVRTTDFDGTVVAEVLSEDARAGDVDEFARQCAEALRRDWLDS